MKVKDAMHKGVDWVSPDTPVTELAPPAPEVFVPALTAWPASLRRPAPPATLASPPALN
jgi:hypothetical protein